MKENLKLGGILLTITLIAGLLLGFTNELTKDQILMNSRVSKDDLAEIMPKADSIREVTVEGTSEGDVSEIYEALSGSNSVGYVLKVTVKGFHGPVDFVVGISDDKVSGIKVLSHSETPGLGAKIEEEEFRKMYSGREIHEELETVKTIPVADNEVEGISGATVSSKATTTAVNTAVKFYREEIKGETVVDKPKEEHNLDLADERLMGMIPGTESIVEYIEGTLPEIIKLYIAQQGSDIIGHIIMVESEGFNSDILMLVGINNEAVISGIEILAQEETEDLGALVVEDAFKSQFVGKKVLDNFNVVFNATKNHNEIEAISGATISSEATVKAVNDAMKYYKDNIMVD